MKLQTAANAICKQYEVKTVPIKTSVKVARGGAIYHTYRIKRDGKISKTHHPRDITIYTWDAIKEHKGEVAYRLGHELAHHVENQKKGSLRHTQSMYDLEERIARKLTKIL